MDQWDSFIYMRMYTFVSGRFRPSAITGSTDLGLASGLHCENPAHTRPGMTRNLCLDCVQTRIQRNPRASLPTLLETLRQIRLGVAAAAAVIHTVIDEAQSDAFPPEMVDTAVQVIGAVMTKLQPREREEAAIALVHSCYQMARGAAESRRVLLATALLPLCLEQRTQRLLTNKAAELLELMINPNLNVETRTRVLETMREVMSVIDLVTILEKRLKVDTTDHFAPQHVTATLELLNRALNFLSPELSVKDLRAMSKVADNLVGIMKRSLMSRDSRLQLSGARCLLTLLLRKELPKESVFLNDNFAEFLMATFSSTHQPLLHVVFRSMLQLCHHRSKTKFYPEDVVSRVLTSLLRALHLFMMQLNDIGAQEITYVGLKLLASLLHRSQQQRFQDVGPQIVQLVRHVLQLDVKLVELRTIAALALAELLLVTSRGEAALWPELMDVVRASSDLHIASQPGEDGSCLVFHLVRGAIPSVSGENAVSREMQMWAEETIRDHAVRCVLGQVSRPSQLKHLLLALETLYSEPSWVDGIGLTQNLASQGFLQLANRFVNDASLAKRGRLVLAHVLYRLAKSHLGADISLDILRDGLLALPSPWLSESSSVPSPEARDAVLVLSYCNALVSLNPHATCRELLPGLLQLLSSPLGTADRLPLLGAKAALLLLGCADAEDSEQVTRLLLRWAHTAHLVFTPHPCLLSWILKRSFPPLEFRATYVAEWLDRGESALKVEENLIANPSALDVVLTVVQGDRRSHVANKASRVILQVASSSIRDHVIEQLWLRLPRLLQQPVTGEHGHALLLHLAVQLGTPADSDVRLAAVAPLCVLLPSLVTQRNPGSWATLARTAAFSVSQLLINTARDAGTAAGVQGLLQDSKFLHALETEVNEREVSDMRRVALKVVTALLAMQQRLGADAPQASGIVSLDSFTLITALEGASASLATPEQKLSLAALQLIAHLPDPCVQDVDPAGYVNVLVTSTTEFISALYVTLHYVQGMRHGDVMELAGWNALNQVIGWSDAQTVVCVPWTHTLLWDTPVPRDAEVALAMLLFTLNWARLLGKVQGKTPSKSRLLNTTVQHLIAGADSFANLEACLAPFIETISACLRLEHELSPQTVKIARSKLEELRLRL